MSHLSIHTSVDWVTVEINEWVNVSVSYALVGDLVFRLDDVLLGELVVQCVCYLVKINLFLSIQNLRLSIFKMILMLEMEDLF